MAQSGGQLGNRNAKKGRMFEQALIREIKQRDIEAGEGETLRRIASVLIDKADGGDLPAARELMDRLDGKPAQIIAGDPDNPLAVELIERRIVDPKA